MGVSLLALCSLVPSGRCVQNLDGLGIVTVKDGELWQSKAMSLKDDTFDGERELFQQTQNET